MAKFDCADPFDIDGGELDGLTPQMIFCLGAEWRGVRDMADKPGGFVQLIHAQNQNRLTALLDRRGRKYAAHFLPNDKSENWVTLTVEPAAPIPE